MRAITSVAFAALLTGLANIAASQDQSVVNAGRAVYSQTCTACHGADGTGALPGVPDFAEASGALAKTDEALITSITNGVSGTMLAMPAKGGNPALTTEDIRAVIAYLRSTFGR